MPPLRDGLADLPMLVERLPQAVSQNHRVRVVSDDVLAVFVAHQWPGDVRELKNVLSRAVPFCDGDMVSLEALERQYTLDVLDRCRGNVSRAAHAADVDRRTLARLIKTHGVTRMMSAEFVDSYPRSKRSSIER